jgi:hypothetical protein
MIHFLIVLKIIKPKLKFIMKNSENLLCPLSPQMEECIFVAFLNFFFK